LELKTWVFFVDVLLSKFEQRPKQLCRKQSIYWVLRIASLDIKPEKREERNRYEHIISKQSLLMVRL